MNYSPRKSSCADLQSRLKVRRVLGVGYTSGSKISQLLGQSDHFIYKLPPTLTTWLLLTTIAFACLTLLVNFIIELFDRLISLSYQGFILSILFTSISCR